MFHVKNIVLLNIMVNYRYVGIAHHKVVIIGPSLPLFPIQRTRIGILVDDRVGIIRFVIDVEAASVYALRGNMRLGNWWHPSLSEASQKVPLGKGSTSMFVSSELVMEMNEK